MKKFLLFIFVWLVCLCPIYAENFYIENYDVEINVDKNKSAQITEDIDVYFTQPSHGIFRNIPFENASVTDIKASETHQNKYLGSSVNIKIGDPNSLISGEHHYKITYNYNYHDNKNEFYHNIIGNDWDVDINHVTFKVTMPQTIDPLKAGLSIGKRGVVGFDGGAVFNINDNVISGNTNKKLSPHEGITLRVEVPEGYFNKYNDYTPLFAIIGMLILTVVGFLTWFFYGKDEQRIPIINFYAPEGLNSIEIELAYKGEASSKGVIALLIELAREGYIKINDNGKKWSIEKIKDYTGEDEAKMILFKTLFWYRDIAKEENLLESKTFYKDCEKIINNTNKKKSKYFYKSSIGFHLKTVMFTCFSGLVFLTLLAISNYNLSYILKNFILCVFVIIAIIIPSIVKTESGFDKILIGIWSLGFGGMPLFIFMINGFNKTAIPISCVGIICLIVVGICAYHLPKRNPTGQNMLNNILGLKKFIEVAEKSKLELLVNEDPEYFYKILPAAYVLDISDKWIKKFEKIMAIQPEWYSGRHFGISSFNHLTESMTRASEPSTANGGISSSSSGGGGGCSGGGGGGGGGGSW